MVLDRHPDMLQPCRNRRPERAHHLEGVILPWIKFLLVVIVLPILIGGVVLLVAGRPIAFEILQRRIAKRFPEVKWVKTEELARWQSGPSQPQPLVLDARTEIEFDVSRLKGAVQIDPYRPSLRP